MKKLVLLFLVSTFIACNKSDDTEDNINKSFIGIEFSVINAKGEDLLNPLHPNHFDESKIKLFYLINGELELPYDGDKRIKGFSISKHENEYKIYILPNFYNTDKNTITHIQWDEHDTDILKVEFARFKYTIIEKNIWINEELVWNGASGDDPYIILEK